MTAIKAPAARRPVPISNAAPAEEVKAPKKPEPTAADTYAATTFEPSKGVQHTDGRLSAKAPYAQLPSDLKSKLREEVWAALPEGQRSTLLTEYQSFKRYGVWDHITQVTGQKEAREAHVKLPGGAEGEVAGNSGAIQFEIKDRKGFTDKLTVLSPKFGVDGGFMGAMHPGQTSMRESGEPTSLHISLGPGNKMDAHIDQVNPVNAPQHGMTTMDLQRGVKHWSTEVLPEKIRQHTGLPGIIVKPELREPTRAQPKADLRLTVNFEVKFGGVTKTEKQVKPEPMEGSRAVPAETLKEITRQVEASGAPFPVPKGLQKGEEPDRQAVAATIAAKIKEAVERGDARIGVDLVQYAGLKHLQQPVAGELRRIADIAREELKKAGVDVSGVTAMTITFGTKTEGETVSILHNGE